MKSLLIIIAIFIVSTPLVCGQTSSHIDSLLSLADYYKDTQLDSLHSIVKQIKNLADQLDDESLKKTASLKYIESLIAFNYYNKADSLLQTFKLTKDSGKIYVNSLIVKGKILNKKGNPDEALKTHYEALEIAQKSGYLEFIPEIYIEVAIILAKNNDKENCFKYLSFSIESSIKRDNVRLLVKALNLMCQAYNGWLIVNLDSSVYYGRKAMQISELNNYHRGVIESKFMVAAPIIRNGAIREGMEMSKEALSYANQYNFTEWQRYILIANLGFAYEELEQYDSAVYYMEKAREVDSVRIDIFRLEYRILRGQGKFEAALKSFETFHKKIINNLENRNETRLSELQARYEANLKAQEVAALTKKNQYQELQLNQQRFFLLGAIVVGLFITLISFLLFRQRQLRHTQQLTSVQLNETQQRLELEKQYRASELKAIRSQMNPHFVFNALNSIQEYIVSNERKLAGKYLGKFADLMRKYLKHSQVMTITLSDELEAMHLYLELEKLRFEDSMYYEICLGKDIDQSFIIPSLLLQPYVENAIKHGLLHKEGERRLILNIQHDHENQLLICTILDNGIGRAASHRINQIRNAAHKSFATKAIKSRLELLNYDNPRPITEEIIDLVDDENTTLGVGTKVIIKIPLDVDWEVEKKNSEITKS